MVPMWRLLFPSAPASLNMLPLTGFGVARLQISMVGPHSPFLLLEIATALDHQQTSLPAERRLETHIATMPANDFGLFSSVEGLNARVTMNIEVFDDQLFEVICPGKARLYSRDKLLLALEYAANVVSGMRVHSILIAGLEPIDSTIAGIKYLASIGVTPIINVFHND